MTRFLAAVALFALAALLAACGGGGSSTATLSATLVPSATPTPMPSVPLNEAWFRGVVTDMRDGRPTDGPLTMTVRVTEYLGGQAPSVGNTAGVFVACSFCIPCQGQWGNDIDKGYNIEVLAKWVDGQLSICDSPLLYARPFGPTPTPSPRYTGPATPSPTP